MKILLFVLILCCGFFSKLTYAQQIVSICYQVPGTSVPYCVPVSSTNPLPVYLPAGH